MADIFIYDEIGPDYLGMVSAVSVVNQLKSAGSDPVTVRINSPGGSVTEAMAIRTALANHAPGVNVFVDGLAASAASWVANVGKKIVMSEMSMMMIHSSINFTYGNVAEHEKTIELLRKVDGLLIDSMSAQSGQTKEKIAEMLAAETWMTAEEAVNLGFAHEIARGVPSSPVNIKPGRYLHTPQQFLANELPRERERKHRETYMANRLRLALAKFA